MVATRLLTVADLAAMGDEAERYELIRGVVREVEGMGIRHGAVGGDLHGHIWTHVTPRGLGWVFTSDTRFVIPGRSESVLGPDVSFVRADRLPLGELPDGFGTLAPDLVVEVVSPSNSEAETHDKISLYLAGGVLMVWLVRPEQRTVTVFRPDAPEVVLGEGDGLDGGAVLPGFRLPIATIFRA